MVEIETMKVYTSLTNAERNELKVFKHVSEICNELHIHDNIKEISEYCSNILVQVNKVHGQKRCNVRNAIIIICIFKILENTCRYNYTILEIAKLANVDKKYIYKAEKLLIELPNKCFEISYIQTPIEYIKKIYTMSDTSTITHDVISETEILLEICENNRILERNSYISKGVCCLYFVLTHHGYNIDMNAFSKTYNVSCTSIHKNIKTLNEFSKIYFV